eukprot:CAMPEP_0205940898 /NCGR_PEP_ID=MMETSP1325-20131115/53538_1 /ASSEMBLY_ACC=CAM_ASM_000708 /TAXON_ID=236786 /ORGANISM="Florenciella sp., Strain RCC1007" /LENGTH=56 /DNA_ID=CAMNT_0053311491 /DNA_START=152 /DNA_END=318 /DNA_ORIENTATION=+
MLSRLARQQRPRLAVKHAAAAASMDRDSYSGVIFAAAGAAAVMVGVAASESPAHCS